MHRIQLRPLDRQGGILIIGSSLASWVVWDGRRSEDAKQAEERERQSGRKRKKDEMTHEVEQWGYKAGDAIVEAWTQSVCRHQTFLSPSLLVSPTYRDSVSPPIHRPQGPYRLNSPVRSNPPMSVSYSDYPTGYPAVRGRGPGRGLCAPCDVNVGAYPPTQITIPCVPRALGL